MPNKRRIGYRSTQSKKIKSQQPSEDDTSSSSPDDIPLAVRILKKPIPSGDDRCSSSRVTAVDDEEQPRCSKSLPAKEACSSSSQDSDEPLAIRFSKKTDEPTIQSTARNQDKGDNCSPDDSDIPLSVRASKETMQWTSSGMLGPVDDGQQPTCSKYLPAIDFMPANISRRPSILNEDQDTSRMDETNNATNELTDDEAIRDADDTDRVFVDDEMAQVVDEVHINDDENERIHHIRTYKNALIVPGIMTEERVQENNIGRMQCRCQYCNAWLFPGEVTSRGSGGRMCCLNGKVNIPIANVCDPVFELLTRPNGEFRKHIRMYNAALSFASYEADLDHIEPGTYVFRVHGTPYHRVGPINPPEGITRRNAQLYIVDNATASGLRGEAFPACNYDLLLHLDQLLRRINPFCEACRMIHEVEAEERRLAEVDDRTVKDIVMVLTNPGDSQHDRRYDVPAANEVAAIFRGDLPENLPNIRVYLQNDHFFTLHMLSPHTDPLTYPLLFPAGERGYHVGIPHDNAAGNVTMREYYAFRMSIRDQFNVVLSSGRLSHQYIVDTWVRTEANRIQFIKEHQKQLRAELYTGLIDHLDRIADHDQVRVGRRVILPNTFINSPRSCYEYYMDSISIFKNVGPPSYFITFTCNPKWAEIENELQFYETANDRPDIVARVFNQKLDELIKDLTTRQVFGVSTSFVYSVEFQKRGLPHAHIVLGVEMFDDVHSREDIDERVCAELPDVNTEPTLYGMVVRHMIHGPCGTANIRSPCMKNGQCSKKYPKPYCNETVYKPSGYPIYRRRENDRNAVVRNSCVDNRHVVPYNPMLLLKYNAHINVEICSGQKWIKYLFKYCFKGPDCILLALHETTGEGKINYDECETYLNNRYVSAPEAYWRLVGFHLVKMSHSVIKLPVHLPGQNLVIFEEGEAANVADNAADTMLTAFFKLNQHDVDARGLNYKEIPSKYRFHQGSKTWMPRKYATKVTSRLYDYSPKDRERYSLRLLLDTVKGPTSYDDLKSVNGQIFDTFQEAAIALHLMVDNQDSVNCMAEAVHYKMPAALRRLFVSICIHNSVNAAELWTRFSADMFEDFLRYRHMNEETAMNAALLHIDYLLRQHGSSCELQGLPVPVTTENKREEIPEPTVDEQDLQDRVHLLNDKQRVCYNKIIEAIDNYLAGRPSDKGFFIDGIAGSGKSFVYETILSYVTARGQTAIVVAVSGIAATLLRGGQTAHSAFKLPLNIDENTTCGISVQSCEANKIRQCAIILWDEASMISCHMLHAVDRTLQDLMDNNLPFGGKVFVLGGDFRQTLPIVKHGSRYDQIQACIKYSHMWPIFEVLELDVNMRAHDGEFSNWVKRLGEGTLDRLQFTDSRNRIHRFAKDIVEIPEQCVCEAGIEDWVFDNINEGTLSTRAVLCPTNADVDEINFKILNKLPGDHTTFLSTNIQPDETEVVLPLEYMQTTNLTGFPPHQLNIKKNAIVMLLRNIDVASGLCNGTRLLVKSIGEHVIKCVPLTGPHRNEAVLLGRLSLTTTDTAVNFVRTQFPLRLSFAMTINKAQGQTLTRAGLYLPKPVFSHGQLYVAMSRARSFEDIKVQVKNGTTQGFSRRVNKTVTKNIVLYEVL